MPRIIKVIEITIIILLLFLSSFFLYQFVNKIHHEKVDTSYMWNIKYQNIKVTEGSKEGEVSEKEKGINLNVTLSQPKEFYEVTFDVVNKGTLKAYIDEITKEIDSTDDILKCQILYKDNGEIYKGDILLPGESKTIKIRIDYPKTKAKVYKELQLTLKFNLNFKVKK